MSGCPRTTSPGLSLDAVGAMDLTAFFAAYRHDGWGRAAHDPAMMVALLVYAYAVGERSSRRIERRCQEDVATRVISVNRAPDHTTIARFRQRHERRWGSCSASAGAMRGGRHGPVEVVAIDGTKVHANAPSTPPAITSRSRARSSNRPRRRSVRG